MRIDQTYVAKAVQLASALTGKPLPESAEAALRARELTFPQTSSIKDIAAAAAATGPRSVADVEELVPALNRIANYWPTEPLNAAFQSALTVSRPSAETAELINAVGEKAVWRFASEGAAAAIHGAVHSSLGPETAARLTRDLYDALWHANPATQREAVARAFAAVG